MNDANDAEKGAVYCVTNPTMPDLVKIGLVEPADDVVRAVKNRINALYSGNTSIPVMFEFQYAVSVDDPHATEKMLHDAFRPYRKNDKREFFSITPQQAKAAMKLTGGAEVTISDETSDDPGAEITQTDINARERAQADADRRLSPFQFHMVKIRPDEKITFVENSDITAEVIDEKNKILFEGEVTTTSGAAKIILERQGRYSSVAGPQYWEYDGETLNERRKRMEKEKAEAKKLDLDE